MLETPYFELLLIKSPGICIINVLNLKKCPCYSWNCSPEAAVTMYLRVKYVTSFIPDSGSFQSLD